MPDPPPYRVLTNAAQVRALPLTDAATPLPVRLRGVVTAINPKMSVFLQDDTGGTFFTQISTNDFGLAPLDDILVEGFTHVGLFMSGIRGAKVRKLGRAELPPPVPVTYDDLLSGRYHYQRVQITGIVRAVTFHVLRMSPTLTLALGPRKIEVEIVVPGVTNLPPLVDARIRIAGLAAGYINARHQLQSPQVLVSRLEDLQIEFKPPREPFEGPLVPATSLMNFDPAGASGHRVRVRGVVTHQQPGQAVFLRDGPDGLAVRTKQASAAKPGDILEAAGFPAMGRFSAYLEDAAFRIVGHTFPPTPILTSVEEVMRGTNDANLVTLEGKVLDVIESKAEAVLVVGDGNTAFRARLPRKPPSLRNGSGVLLSGVCLVQDSTSDTGSRFRANPLEMELLLRSPDDIAIIARPPAWSPYRFAAAAGILLGVSLIAGVWVVLLRRRVAEQAEVIHNKVQREAALEERHRMAREFHDTLAQSFSGLGFQLDALKARLSDTDKPAHAQLDIARQMVQYGQEDFRRSLMNLRAQELERGGLEEALPELARQITAGTGIELRCNIQHLDHALSETVETNLLRISQESLANATRHGRPGHIELSLTSDHEGVQLRIADNGVGFDAEQTSQTVNGHFGLRGIYERAQQIDARVELRSEPNRGTTITVTVPF